MKNQYNVTVLIEDTGCTKLYNPEIENFKQNISEKFNSHNIQYYKFTGKNDQILMDSSYKQSNSSDNNLVFIVATCTSTIWGNGEIYNLIENLQTGALVNIINVLPKKLWDKTRLDIYSNITTIESEMKNNASIINELPFLISKDEFKDSLIIPMADINHANQLMDSILKGGKVDNILLYKGDHSVPTFKSQEIITTNQEITSYRTLCSDEAFSLTMYLSVLDSFTLSDMQLIKEYTLPEADKSVLAQCILSGMVESSRSNNTIYHIKENIKQQLSQTISSVKAFDIKLLIEQQEIKELNDDNKAEMKNKKKM